MGFSNAHSNCEGIWRTTASQEYIKSVLLDTPGTFYSYSSVDSSFQEQYQKARRFWVWNSH